MGGNGTYERVISRRYKTVLATYLRVVGPGPIGTFGRRGLLADLTHVSKDLSFPPEFTPKLVVGGCINMAPVGIYLDFVIESRSGAYNLSLFQH